MSKRETIDEWSLLYWFLQKYIVRPLYNFYYRKIQIINADRIPDRAPVIIAPNHQNALMDALAFVAGIKYQTVFLARADVFKGKLVTNILTFLKILPIYRIRDGISSLQKNEEIFDITVNVLRNKINPLLLFPEGNHGNRRRLRQLVKGIFRIAFKAQEDFKDKPGVKIIPVGIDYSHYWKFRHTQFINFGEPIEVYEYWKAYEENSTQAMNSLRERLANEMKKYMIHIETEVYYKLYMDLRQIYKNKMCKKLKLKSDNLHHAFIADKKLIEILDDCLEHEPERIAELNKVFREYAGLRNRLNYRNWVPSKNRYSIIWNVFTILVSIVCWPVVLLGLFNNWPHFFIPVRFQKKIRDTQFFSTAKWGAGTAILLIYYLILFILALIFLPLWWIKILYIITLPFSGIFAISYRKFLIKSWVRIRYSFSVRNANSETALMKVTYDKLVSELDVIVDERMPSS